MTKWMCNDKKVLNTVPYVERAVGVKEVVFDKDHLPTERALGVLWDLERDELGVRVQAPSKPETKRGLLSAIHSVFDPLGLVAPTIVTAKLIFQDECRRQLGWDEPITDRKSIA